MPALVFVSQLASLLATILVPGIVLIVVLKKGWMRRLAVPIDAGAMWPDGRPVLGATKTWLGVVIYVGGAAVVSGALGHPGLAAWVAPVMHWPLSGAVGFSIGVAYVLGELINSFVKRRLGVSSSVETTTRWRPVQRIADLADGIVAVSVLLLALGSAPLLVVGTALVGVAVHAATDLVMHRLRLKSR
jgi:CDP-diglyceride synthetase